LYYLINIFWM